MIANLDTILATANTELDKFVSDNGVELHTPEEAHASGNFSAYGRTWVPTHGETLLVFGPKCTVYESYKTRKGDTRTRLLLVVYSLKTNSVELVPIHIFADRPTKDPREDEVLLESPINKELAKKQDDPQRASILLRHRVLVIAHRYGHGPKWVDGVKMDDNPSLPEAERNPRTYFQVWADDSMPEDIKKEPTKL